MKDEFHLSKEDCIVKNFQKKESNSCGCNKKCLYFKNENKTDVEICSESVKCNLDFGKVKLLSEFCVKIVLKNTMKVVLLAIIEWKNLYF
jgi:hypothetical protein